MVFEVEVTKALSIDLRMADLAARKMVPWPAGRSGGILIMLCGFGRQDSAEATRRLQYNTTILYTCLLPAVPNSTMFLQAISAKGIERFYESDVA